MDTFSFCPDRMVAETLPRDAPQSVMSLNGWQFTARPTTPYQRKLKVTLHGLRWYTQANGLYDTTTNPTFNARLLEQFYEAHETWDPFLFNHPHFGTMTVRFAATLAVPAGLPNSGGLIGPVEVNFIHHNPGF